MQYRPNKVFYLMGGRLRCVFAGRGRIEPAERERARQLLERVGLAGLAKSPIEALSGGQFQRMLFARVMVQQAPLVMLDEPFTGIDEATCRELMELILEMHQQGQTILAVLHDNQRVADFFPETLLLTPQRACWGATRAVLPAFSHVRSA